MNQTFRLYMVVMGVSAVILAVFVAFNPALRDGPVPSFVYLFLPSLAFDMTMLSKINEGKIPPLKGMDRGIGMITAAILHMGLLKVLVG